MTSVTALFRSCSPNTRTMVSILTLSHWWKQNKTDFYIFFFLEGASFLKSRWWSQNSSEPDYRWDIPGGRFLQVSQAFLSDYITMLGSQRPSPRLFIPAANMITISPFNARHLPFPRCCHIICTPLIHPTSWKAGACLPISQWEDSRAEGWSIQFSLSLPFFFSPSLPAPFLSSLPPSPVHTNIHGALTGCKYCAWSSGYNLKNSLNNNC